MTTVLIWNNRQVRIGGHTYMGHASLNIDDNWKWGLASRFSYVSFWPSGAGGGAHLLGGAVAATSNASITSDIAAEGYAPDHILRLKGLTESAMTAEWRNMSGALKNYQALRNNCSSVVATILKKGSAGGSMLRRHSVIWTPLNVKAAGPRHGGRNLRVDALSGRAGRVRRVDDGRGIRAERVRQAG